jgi:hypothetical protein
MKRAILLMCGISLLVAISALGSVTGSISGTVTDTVGSVVPGATVMAQSVETGINTLTKTNTDGAYSFPDLPPGHYNILVQAKGFSELHETGVVLNVNTALRVDAKLRAGVVTSRVEVLANAIQIDMVSTQLGDVIGSKAMTSVPLNGRSFTDLLALQPGVSPQSDAGTASNGVSSYSPSPSGNLDSGTLPINGAQGSSNGFMINGSDVQELLANGTSIIPNLDSIAEFRIITNNFDAEYGHYSGGIVNVITKSGTNQFHGDAFDFLRNTDLDARNYYSLTRGVYRQNQFGGTVGGPIVRNSAFFFADYQGTRLNIGDSTGLIPVPSVADREGNLADESSLLSGTVIGPAVADTLSQKLGYPVSVGEPFYTSGCTTATCVFPNATIPKSVWAAPAANLLQYIPLPNVPSTPSFPTGAYSGVINSQLQDNKGGIRLDANSGWGLWSGYYFVDKFSTVNPFGDSFGLFGMDTKGLSQLYAFSNIKTFGSKRVNEFRASYTRNNYYLNSPSGPTVNMVSLGFAPCSPIGTCPQDPSFTTLPGIGLNDFTIGDMGMPEALVEGTWEGRDSYSLIVGNHSLAFGGIFSLNQVLVHTYWASNGLDYINGGAETGLDFADFLLGAVSTYNQGVQLPVYDRALYYGLYAQDSWRARKNLTLNYGLRWDVTTPWWEKYNRMNALWPGRQSATFPTAPEGWVVPGDPGVPTTIAPTQYSNLAPRVGFAYSPDPEGGVWQKLIGGYGKSSIRGSFGLFYDNIMDFMNANDNGGAPFGLTWTSPTPAMLATPFVDLYTGNLEGQRFPIPTAPLTASPSHPANLDWAEYEPINTESTYYHGNVIPYDESWMLSYQRQLVPNAILSIDYVGNVGRHNMVTYPLNDSVPSVCLSVSQPSEVAPGSNVCGPNSETGPFTTSDGQVVYARQQPGLTPGAFGGVSWYRTMGGSSYNSLQTSLQYSSGRLWLLAAYTYSKSMDDASAATDPVVPYDPGMQWALSDFNVTQNFVVSYSYQLPFEDVFSRPSRLTKGWVLSGDTRFSTGFPVTLMENDDRSLLGVQTGDGATLDVPSYTPGKLLSQTNPRKGGTYFNTSLFSMENLGQLGDAKRRFFSGPGLNNWDMALAKDIQFVGSNSLELRFEAFNLLNHAQFQTPTGLINSSAFGVVTGANDPRVMQVAAKFHF